MAKIAETVLKNKLIRQDANEICELIDEWMADKDSKYSEDDKRLFWDTILQLMPSRFRPQPEVKRARPMSDDETKRYGAKLLGFGKYADKEIQNIPVEYLLWLDGHNQKLSRYLASDYIQKEQ